MVEIAWDVAPAWRRRGLAVEAAIAMCAWAFRQGVRAVVAEVADQASAGVAERSGFLPGEEGRFILRRP